MATDPETGITVRHTLQPGDLGRVVELHAVRYAEEYGFDHGFEAYVAEPIAELGRQYDPARDRLWIAERAGCQLGSVAIVGREDGTVQLRWFLIHPDARGQCLGRRLIDDALAFCRAAGYRSVYLWTVKGLDAAAHLYRAAGFEKTETKPETTLWSVPLAEERYDLAL